MTESISIAIYGAGGFAREVAWLVESCPGLEVVCYIDDDEQAIGKLIRGIPIVSFEMACSRYRHANVVSGIGSPKARECVMKKVASAGFTFQSLIHPRVVYSQWINVGKGTVICAGSILTTDITLGEHVQINLDCTVGHDVMMEDYTTLAPGAHISGNVHLGKRVYVGTGAVIINGTPEHPLIIGDDVVIGAGACVIGDVVSGETVVGIPARPIIRR